MSDFTLLHLCKKVSKAGPKSSEPAPLAKFAIEHVSILSGSLCKYVNSWIQMEKKERKTTSLEKDKIGKEAAHVHRCSIDFRHHHLMIHGEALARHMMKQKKIFVANPLEQAVANYHLKKLDLVHASLQRRFIIQVDLEDDPSAPYSHPMPPSTVDCHFRLTSII